MYQSSEEDIFNIIPYRVHKASIKPLLIVSAIIVAIEVQCTVTRLPTMLRSSGPLTEMKFSPSSLATAWQNTHHHRHYQMR